MLCVKKISKKVVYNRVELRGIDESYRAYGCEECELNLAGRHRHTYGIRHTDEFYD